LKHHVHANEAGDNFDKLKKAQKSEDTKIGSISKGDENQIDHEDKAAEGVSNNANEVDATTAPLEVLVKKKAHFGGMLCH
jgi:hypothetical protein